MDVRNILEEATKREASTISTVPEMMIFPLQSPVYHASVSAHSNSVVLILLSSVSFPLPCHIQANLASRMPSWSWPIPAAV